MVPEDNLEATVENQKRPEDVSLVIGPSPLKPDLGILEREPDVVDMDDHSRSYLRQHLEDQPVDVAAHFGNVGAVDHEEVAGRQLEERVKGDVLYPIDDHLAPELIVGM
jgi:hypothetical protein